MSESASLKRVSDYYNRDPQREWARFDRHVFEFPVTMHFLRKYLEPDSRVLDVGSGPGRYAIELSQLGHTVELVDISQELLNIAQQKSEEAGLSIAKFHLGSATDLSSFPTDSQDAVLCMGPMYHLKEQADRDAAIFECLRTLRPGGLIFIAFVSVLGRVFDIVRNYPEKLPAALARITKIVTGPSASSSEEHRFTDAYFVQPSDIGQLMDAYPIEPLDLLGVEGLTSQSESVITDINDEVTNAWIDLAIGTASTPAAIHGSDHILYIGRKK